MYFFLLYCYKTYNVRGRSPRRKGSIMATTQDNRTHLRFLHCSDIHLETPFFGLTPEKSEERRREIKKQVQKYAEEAKVAIRNIRRDANEDAKKQKKDGLLTEDDQKAAEKTIQDITDKNIKKIEEIQAKKEKEIMAI